MCNVVTTTILPLQRRHVDAACNTEIQFEPMPMHVQNWLCSKCGYTQHVRVAMYTSWHAKRQTRRSNHTANFGRILPRCRAPAQVFFCKQTTQSYRSTAPQRQVLLISRFVCLVPRCRSFTPAEPKPSPHIRPMNTTCRCACGRRSAIDFQGRVCDLLSRLLKCVHQMHSAGFCVAVCNPLVRTQRWIVAIKQDMLLSDANANYPRLWVKQSPVGCDLTVVFACFSQLTCPTTTIWVEFETSSSSIQI